MRPQLSIKSVKGDGNCLPRSISELMGMDHADVRMCIVAEVLNNPTEYQCFEQDINQWAADMEKDGAWADGLAVKAASNCLNVPIVVFRKRNPDQPPSAFLPPIVDDTPDLDPMCVELDEPAEGCEHYNPLVRNSATVVNVAAPLRKRLYGKQSPTKTVAKPAEADDWVPKKSPKTNMLFRRMKRMVADEDEPDNGGKTSHGGLTLGDLAKRKAVRVEPPSGDIVEAAASIPVGVAASIPVEAEASIPAVVEAVASIPVGAEASNPLEAEASIPLEDEASIPVEAGASVPCEVEASVDVDEETFQEDDLFLLPVLEDAEVAVPVAEIAEAPTRRLKKKRRKMKKTVEAEAVIPMEADASVHIEAEASTHKEAEASIPDEAEASIPDAAEASIPDAAEASMPTRRIKKKKHSKKRKSETNDVTPIVADAKATGPIVADAKATGPPADTGFFVKGTVMKIEEEGRCGKCHNMVEKSRAKISGKGKNYWVCKTCHTRCTQLSNIYGGWPPKHFKLLSPEKRVTYFNDIKEIHDQKELQLHTANFFRTTMEDNKGTKDTIEYLPLSVWKQRGFNVRKIKRRCTDIQHHNVLGKLYGLETTQKWNGHQEKQVRGEDHTVDDKPQLKPSAPSKASVPAGVSREEKKAAMEAVRSEKARATQEARSAKYNMSLCQRFLRRNTKLSFNLGKALSPKFVKKLPAATQKKLEATKAKLSETQKALMNTMRSAGKNGIDEKECEQACKDGESLIGQLVGANMI